MAAACMQLSDHERHIRDVYLADIRANVLTIQRHFKTTFMSTTTASSFGDVGVEDVHLPDAMQMINMTFTMENFVPSPSGDETVTQGLHRACRAIFVDNPTAQAMMTAMGFKATRVSDQKMRNSVMVELDRGDACCLVRAWSNGKFAIMTGARTFEELFTCAKLISVLTHVGAGRSPHEACVSPIDTMNVYLVNVPMKIVMRQQRSINIIRLQRMLTTRPAACEHDPNLLMGFSVGRNARSNLQQQGNFEVSFVDMKVTLKVFISSNGNMRVYLATNKPVEMFVAAVGAVAGAIAAVAHECVADRTIVPTAKRVKGSTIMPKKRKNTADTTNIKNKKVKIRHHQQDDEDEEQHLNWLGFIDDAMWGGGGDDVVPKPLIIVKKEEEEEGEQEDDGSWFGFNSDGLWVCAGNDENEEEDLVKEDDKNPIVIKKEEEEDMTEWIGFNDSSFLGGCESDC